MLGKAFFKRLAYIKQRTHSKGWPRIEAIEFTRKTTALTVAE